MAFAHEKMPVYKLALDFMRLAHDVANGLAGHGNLKDQLLRAASSIVLNLAEGAGKYAPKDKRRYYRSFVGSAAECSAILDVLLQMSLLDEERTKKGKDVLDHIAAMGTNLIRSLPCGDDDV